MSYYLGYSRPGFGLVFFLLFRVALSLYLPVAAASGSVYFKMAAAMRYKVQTGLEQRIGKEATPPRWQYKP